MQVLRILEVDLYDSRGALPGARKFEEQYAAYRSGPTTTFVFTEPVPLSDAIAFLNARQLSHREFYAFRLSSDEMAGHPAFYFGMVMLDDLLVGDAVNPNVADDLDLAKDYKSERIVVSARTRTIIGRESRDVNWLDVPSSVGRVWSSLLVKEKLPEPLRIVQAVEMGLHEGTSDIWWVRSDGRDIITDRNAVELASLGLAWIDQIAVGSETRMTVRRLVASGQLMSELVSAGIVGLLTPVTPLLPEDHPLVRRI